MIWLSNEFIHKHIDYVTLINALESAFRDNNIICPPKTIHTYSGINDIADNTFLYMPSWDNQTYYGCKLITTTPDNNQHDLPYINGLYILFDAQSGQPLVSMDAKVITNYRTAATSALAASKLINPSSSTLLILGNGAIAPYMIAAHQSVHQYKTILLWGRNYEKSKGVLQHLEDNEDVSLQLLTEYKDILKSADVISCITSSKNPLIHHANLGLGQHIDLVGSFTHDMHEIATDVVTHSQVYTDNRDTTPFHAGELVRAMEEDVFKIEDIQGDLFDLCQISNSIDYSDNETTIFKSTGMGLEDLVIAVMLYEHHQNE